MITYKKAMVLRAGDTISRHPVDDTPGRWPVAGCPVQFGDIAEIPYTTPSGIAWLTASVHVELTLVTTPRQDVIAGLRELCDFLEANPHIPVRDEQEVLYIASTGRSVDDAVREVNRVGRLMGRPAGQRSTSHVARRIFHGAVVYEAVAVRAYPKEAA